MKRIKKLYVTHIIFFNISNYMKDIICPRCDSVNQYQLIRMPEKHKHRYKLECACCGRYLQWVSPRDIYLYSNNI